MIKIAICDDNYDDVLKLEKCIKVFQNENSVSAVIYKYKSGEDILSTKIPYDLIFLDIEMKKMNGIETAQKIRAINTTVQIVYVTSHSSHWREAYKVHAYGFVSKPFKNKEIFKVLSDYINMKRENETKQILFDVDNGFIVQNPNEIMYLVFLERNRVLMSTVFGEYEVKGSLNDIYSMLDHDDFYMTHKDTIVNLKYVKRIDPESRDNIIMSDERKLALSRRKYKEFYLFLSKKLRSDK